VREENFLAHVISSRRVKKMEKNGDSFFFTVMQKIGHLGHYCERI